MRNLYEQLIRRFGAAVNEGAEDLITPRDVVHLAQLPKAARIVREQFRRRI